MSKHATKTLILCLFAGSLIAMEHEQALVKPRTPQGQNVIEWVNHKSSLLKHACIPLADQAESESSDSLAAITAAILDLDPDRKLVYGSDGRQD